jgi:hypothetical protein
MVNRSNIGGADSKVSLMAGREMLRTYGLHR